MRHRLSAAIAPRDLDAAARVGSAFLFGGALAVAVLTGLVPTSAGPGLGPVFTWITVAVLATLGAITRALPHRLPTAVWPLVPTVAIVLITVLDLTSHDSSAGGQIFFCWPVLYASQLLRPPIAWLVCVEVVAADAAVSFRLCSPSVAAENVIAVAVTMAVVTLTVSRARDRVDAALARLAERASTDGLTGLVNRDTFDGRVAAALADAAPDRPAALLVIDLDGFKQVNDGHGHPVGDAVLRRVAALLRTYSRPGDVIGRLGGDELAVLLAGCGPEAALTRAEELRAALAALGHDDDGEVAVGPVTASIGVAVAPRDAADARGLFAAADRALYDAKNAGRNRVRLVAS